MPGRLGVSSPGRPLPTIQHLPRCLCRPSPAPEMSIGHVHGTFNATLGRLSRRTLAMHYKAKAAPQPFLPNDRVEEVLGADPHVPRAALLQSGLDLHAFRA